jgi:hypothetical protein
MIRHDAPGFHSDSCRVSDQYWRVKFERGRLRVLAQLKKQLEGESHG